MVQDHIKVRAKVVLKVSELDVFNMSKEKSQQTVSFRITQVFSESDYNAFIALLKTGNIYEGSLGPE